MIKKYSLLILVIIILLGALLRLVNLSTMPPSLNWDEISHGYNAYSILRTGMDEWGVHFPVANFRAYGDYPLTLNLYLTVPFVWAFGLTAFAIRFPHALLGIGTIIVSYLLSYGVTKKKGVSLVVAFLVSVDPWYVFTSRFVLQSNLSVFLLTAGMAAFVHRKSNKYLLPISTFLLGLTLFSYHTTRIFTPLLLVSIAIIFRKEFFTKLNIFIAVLFLLPLPFILLNPNARARSAEVFLINDGSVAAIEYTRNNSSLPALFSKIIYNRPAYLIEQSLLHYVDYFSPQFLFLRGGTQYQFSVPDQGLLYLFSAPFFYIGFILLIYRATRKKDKLSQILLIWILLAPIPASITTERFAVLRSSSMLPIPEVLTSMGLYEIVELLRSRKLKLFSFLVPSFILLTLLGLIHYISIYTESYKTNYSWAWQYGYSQVVQFSQSHYNEFDQFIITKKFGEPHEYVLFYTAWSPNKYMNDTNLVRYTQSNWWWVDSFDKYVFVNDWQIPKIGEKFVTERKAITDCATLKCALITSEGNAPEGWKKIQTILFLDGKTAFEIYENK